MKLQVLLLTFFIYTTGLFAQKTDKPLINETTFNSWPSIGNGKLSDDGLYALYTVSDNKRNTRTLFVSSANGTWTKHIENVISGDFNYTADGKSLFFSLPGDSLVKMTLGTDSLQYLTNISWYKYVRNRTGEWMICRQNEQGKKLILCNLENKKEWKFECSGELYLLDEDNILMLQSSVKTASNNIEKLIYIDFKNGAEHLIREGHKAEQITVSRDGRLCAFVTRDTSDRESFNTIWQYEFPSHELRQLKTDVEGQMSGNFKFESLLSYNYAGDCLLIMMKENKGIRKASEDIKVDIFDYKDRYFKPQPTAGLTPATCIAALLIKDLRIVRLKEGEEEVQNDISDGRNPVKDWLLIVDSKGKTFNEIRLDKSLKANIFLTATNSGKRVVIKNDEKAFVAQDYNLSPAQKYIHFYDQAKKNFFTYDIKHGRLNNVSEKIPPLLITEENEIPMKYSFSPEGWIEEDNALILSDKFDLWMVDPNGKEFPINLTEGFGKNSLTEFHLMDINTQTGGLGTGQRVFLSGFNRKSKELGIFQITLSKQPQLKKIYSGQYCYGYNGSTGSISAGFCKASNAEMYLIQRETASEFPNYYITSDFKKVEPISNIHPEKEYNWVTSELVSWSGDDSLTRQGILYKPENFDSTKKYPVIFYYYETLSYELNMFRYPEASTGRMNIPYFVSNGYLVFCVDIYYRRGAPSKSALESVVSAAHNLARRDYIDTTKMGLQGHSFGGYETNCIITQTNMFAAACSAAGVSDLISLYNSVDTNLGISRNSYFELSQGRIGRTFWDRPDLYIENSPLFNSDKVITPLLMMNNKNDLAVPYTQGMEFFSALKRQHKKVWMLQYDDGGHNVEGRSADDFHKRLCQFFDYYLKGKPAPSWMNEATPDTTGTADSHFYRSNNGPK